MALDFTRLTEEVGRDNQVNASAAQLIGRLADELARIKTTDEAAQAQIDALVTNLRDNQNALAEAVAKNTPVDGTEPPVSNQPPAEPTPPADETPSTPNA